MNTITELKPPLAEKKKHVLTYYGKNDSPENFVLINWKIGKIDEILEC